MINQGRIYQRKGLQAFLAKHREKDVLVDPLSLEAALKSNAHVIVRGTASVDGLSSLIQAAERMKEIGQFGVSIYAPVLFMRNENVSRIDKLLLAFNALALSLV